MLKLIKVFKCWPPQIFGPSAGTAYISKKSSQQNYSLTRLFKHITSSTFQVQKYTYVFLRKIYFLKNFVNILLSNLVKLLKHASLFFKKMKQSRKQKKAKKNIKKYIVTYQKKPTMIKYELEYASREKGRKLDITNIKEVQFSQGQLIAHWCAIEIRHYSTNTAAEVGLHTVT